MYLMIELLSLHNGAKNEKNFSGHRRPIPARDHNPYVEAFWTWWPNLYPELKHFRMTGGEPLMDRNTYRVFDYVLDHPKSDLHLAVTSNFSVEPALSTKYFDYVKRLCNTDIEHFMQYVSLDSGVGSQAEYIRHGLNFDRLQNNVETYLRNIPYRNSLTFIVTMNNLSVTGFLPLMQWILDLRRRHSQTYQRVWFDTPVLRQPAWQSLQTLPESYVGKLEKARDFMLANLETAADPFHGFKDYEVQRLERDIAWMRSTAPQPTAMADFYRTDLKTAADIVNNQNTLAAGDRRSIFEQQQQTTRAREQNISAERIADKYASSRLGGLGARGQITPALALREYNDLISANPLAKKQYPTFESYMTAIQQASLGGKDPYAGWGDLQITNPKK
jgi:hypothetical protein